MCKNSSKITPKIKDTKLPTVPGAFIFFRIFDIWKPSIIGKIDREVKGGLGVMGDDVVAGIFAGICTAGVWQLIEKFVI